MPFRDRVSSQSSEDEVNVIRSIPSRRARTRDETERRGGSSDSEIDRQNRLRKQTRRPWACDVCHPEYRGHVIVASLPDAAAKCYRCQLLLDILSSFRPNCFENAVQEKANKDEPRTIYVEWETEVDKVKRLKSCPSVIESSELNLNLRVMNVYQDKYPSAPIPDCGDRTSGDTGSQACLFKVMQWVLDCSSNHSCARHHESNSLPTRLLYIGMSQETWKEGRSDEKWIVKLVDSEDLSVQHEAPPAYMCLSYCWGGVSDSITTSSNLKDRMDRIAWTTLPKTFQDFITFARGLQIRYVWIDALCIIQDDINDWAREAGRMADVYANSFLTVSAMTGENNKSGLFSQSFHGTAPVKKFTFPTLAEEELSLLAYQVLPHQSLYYNRQKARPDKRDGPEPTDEPLFPLLRRAWVLQERLLSPRVIHFTPHEVMWECIETGRCECGRLGRLDNQNGKPEMFLQNRWGGDTSKDRKLLDWWHDVVETFSNLDLTYSRDKLPALAGVAAKMERDTGARYLAGIWANDLANELRWRICDLDNINFWFKRSTRAVRSPEYRSPTWSWACLDASFSELYDDHKLRSYGCDGQYMSILESISDSIGPFGPVQFAHITMLGFVAECSLVYPSEAIATVSEETPILDKYYGLRFSDQKVLPFLADYPLYEAGTHHLPGNTTLFCLRIGRMNWDEKVAYIEKGDDIETSHLVSTWGYCDLLVLRLVERRETEMIEVERGDEDSNLFEGHITVYERVGLVPFYDMGDDYEAHIFEQVLESAIRLV